MKTRERIVITNVRSYHEMWLCIRGIKRFTKKYGERLGFKRSGNTIMKVFGHEVTIHTTRTSIHARLS